MRKSLRWLIATLGVPVETFPSAASFLDAYHPDGPSCLVVDVLMPAMTGLELQQELRRRGDQIPVIVLTAYANVPSAVDALKHGAIEFLEKPFESGRSCSRESAMPSTRTLGNTRSATSVVSSSND